MSSRKNKVNWMPIIKEVLRFVALIVRVLFKP